MKSIRSFLIGMVITGSLAAGLLFLHAQETATSTLSQQAVNSMSDTEVMLQAIESVPPAPASTAPRSGTFWSAQHPPGSRYAWPPLPSDNGLPIWNLGDGVYLLDDLPVMSSSMAGGMMMADGSDYVGGLSNIDIAAFLIPPVYTTNDLWLQMDGITNTTAYLTIHPPWTVTNGVYDLYYTTNLTAPATWSWVMRSFAGLTNLTVNNATDAQGFYRLGPLNDPIGNNSLGTNFWVAFPTMDPYGVDPPYYATNRELWLYISSPVGASGTVTIPGFGITTNFTVAAGAVTNMCITNIVMMGSPLRHQDGSYENYLWWGAVQNNGINIASSQPVSVYAVFYEAVVGADFADTAAFTCYPTTLLGTNYCLMSRPPFTGGDSVFDILATADNTTVNINPSATADLAPTETGDLNEPYSITLQQGQVYQIPSSEFATDNFPPFIDDVTGTWIGSDKPIAVFAGASGAYVPDQYTSDYNPLVQEQLPVESWGTMALGLSFAGRTNGDSYRVLAAYSNTVVNISGTVVTILGMVTTFTNDSGIVVTSTNESGPGPWQVSKTNEVVVTNLDAGQFCDFIIDGPAEFQASKPIQVAQFANGEVFDTPANFYGDPCEILLPPVGHWLETNTVVTLTNDLPNKVIGDFAENFLNLIVAQSAITNTFVDTNLVAATNFVAIGASGYYGAQIVVTNSGAHTVTSSHPVEVQVYGFGFYDAYGFLGGVVK